MTTDELVRHLLPKNATRLERAAAATLLARLDDMPMLIDAIWTPAGCPTPLLRFLAFAVSVDVWDDDWPESVRRDVIAAAPQVHRKKGTVMAVEAALKALGIRADTEEWWQSEPVNPRGTFTVTAYANLHLVPGEAVLSAEVQAQVLRQIQAVKPKARAFTFRIGGEWNSSPGPGSAFASTEFHRTAISADRPDQLLTTIDAGSAIGTTQFGRFHCVAAP